MIGCGGAGYVSVIAARGGRGCRLVGGSLRATAGRGPPPSDDEDAREDGRNTRCAARYGSSGFVNRTAARKTPSVPGGGCPEREAATLVCTKR